jgi:DNA-binding NarL/FixJ family response regulator
MTMTSYFPMADALTSREQEITRLVSTGLSNKEIAQHLNISEATVKIHMHNIFRKLRVNNRTALAAANRSRPLTLSYCVLSLPSPNVISPFEFLR